MRRLLGLRTTGGVDKRLLQDSAQFLYTIQVTGHVVKPSGVLPGVNEISPNPEGARFTIALNELDRSNFASLHSPVEHNG